MSDVIRSHGLAAPTETSAVESIARVVGESEARAVWQRAREQSGFGNPNGSLDLPSLLLVADTLSRYEGFHGVMGTALRIRIQTFQMLNDHAD